ncbi:Lrp/AsnC ligand binding domain-containing protein [Streptomyces sp. T028]|uniref:Lrp/AsnC ligand binding domain-containing protein n=1 Tax=Streptomyces sp. T028 TaxID=3394379 RepID=UPI003A84F8BC
MQLISDIRLREAVDRWAFEEQLADVPQVISAVRMTGEYDFQLRVACADAREFETVVDRLKAELGVREVRSRLVLHEVALDPGRAVEP